MHHRVACEARAFRGISASQCFIFMGLPYQGASHSLISLQPDPFIPIRPASFIPIHYDSLRVIRGLPYKGGLGDDGREPVPMPVLRQVAAQALALTRSLTSAHPLPRPHTLTLMLSRAPSLALAPSISLLLLIADTPMIIRACTLTLMSAALRRRLPLRRDVSWRPTQAAAMHAYVCTTSLLRIQHESHVFSS